MCDVHLVETERVAVIGFKGACSSITCGGPIAADEECIRIRGHRDNGEPGTLTYHYHIDCADHLEFEEGEDGCFTYGDATEETP